MRFAYLKFDGKRWNGPRESSFGSKAEALAYATRLGGRVEVSEDEIRIYFAEAS